MSNRAGYEPDRSHEPAPPAAARVPAPAERVTRMLEREGQLWVVYEHVRPYDRRSTPDLVFESDMVVRRVRDYPDDWARLPDDALWRLHGGR